MEPTTGLVVGFGVGDVGRIVGTGGSLRVGEVDGALEMVGAGVNVGLVDGLVVGGSVSIAGQNTAEADVYGSTTSIQPIVSPW